MPLATELGPQVSHPTNTGSVSVITPDSLYERWGNATNHEIAKEAWRLDGNPDEYSLRRHRLELDVGVHTVMDGILLSMREGAVALRRWGADGRPASSGIVETYLMQNVPDEMKGVLSGLSGALVRAVVSSGEQMGDSPHDDITQTVDFCAIQGLRPLYTKGRLDPLTLMSVQGEVTNWFTNDRGETSLVILPQHGAYALDVYSAAYNPQEIDRRAPLQRGDIVRIGGYATNGISYQDENCCVVAMQAWGEPTLTRSVQERC